MQCKNCGKTLIRVYTLQGLAIHYEWLHLEVSKNNKPFPKGETVHKLTGEYYDFSAIIGMRRKAEPTEVRCPWGVKGEIIVNGKEVK